MGGLEKEGGFGCVEGGLELLAAFSFFDMKKSVERERMWWKARSDERGGDGGWAGEDGEFYVLIAAGFEEAMAGIGEAGRAGIGADGDLFAALGAGDEFGNAVLLVVIVERDERF